MYKVDDKEAPLICFEKKITLSIFKYEQKFSQTLSKLHVLKM